MMLLPIHTVHERKRGFIPLLPPNPACCDLLRRHTLIDSANSFTLLNLLKNLESGKVQMTGTLDHD